VAKGTCSSKISGYETFQAVEGVYGSVDCARGVLHLRAIGRLRFVSHCFNCVKIFRPLMESSSPIPVSLLHTKADFYLPILSIGICDGGSILNLTELNSSGSFDKLVISSYE
jgi:hypothetical protein